MKAKYYKGIGATAIACMLFFSSCLKDNGYINFAGVGTLVEMPKGGFINFGGDALTESSDTIVRMIAVNIASPNPLKTALTVTIGFSQADFTAYNAANPAIAYLPFPAGSYVLPPSTVTIPAGQRLAEVPITFYKSKLDPSKSYMLPLAILSTDNPAVVINATYPAHYYHFIGNDFAGSYTWDYRRWQNGTGPGAGMIPSQGQGIPPDITGLGQTTVLSPVSPTEFQMVTGYNGQGVNYDVTFNRTVSGSTVTYSNWSVQFLPADIAKWTGAGITNHVPPAFTVPPPATGTDPHFFELNYISGGAFARYIDDTYHH
jgi:hypothetical protein